MTPERFQAGVLLALSRLPEAGPARLRWCAEQPAEALWKDVLAGRQLAPDWSTSALARDWSSRAELVDPAVEIRRHEAAGVRVSVFGAPGYPDRLLGDPRPPAILCSFGPPLQHLGSVGIVGTRKATAYGVGVARELGEGLAEAGIAVVSGLALGIDAAAQSAALAAGGAVVGVVAGGLDHVYPRRNAALWAEVSQRGWLLTEVPLGIPPVRWRFPIRNRIIAALSDVLVVVESNHAGGSMHTVRQAAARSVTVMAVPGSVRSPTSDGTNQLIADGCPPCCGLEDILVALGLATAGARFGPDPGRADLTADERRVLDAIGSECVTLEEVVCRLDMAPADVALTVVQLELSGVLGSVDGLLERR